MFRAFSKSGRVPPPTAMKRQLSDRTSRGPFATRDQDMPKEVENVSELTKKEAAIEHVKSEVASCEDTITYRWKKFDELMWKVLNTKLDAEDEKAILAEAEDVEKEAMEAERKRDSLKLQLISMTWEDGGGDGGDSSVGGGSGGSG